MAKQERVILVTNDDGITAPGIRALIKAVKPLGKVVVVAPDSPQSGKGHAITIGIPLRLDPVNIFEGIEAWQCSGTPVDCVKLARAKILHGRKAGGNRTEDGSGEEMALDLHGLEAPFPVGEFVQLAFAGEGLEMLEGRRLAALERAGNLARRGRDAVLALVFPHEIQNLLLSFSQHRLSSDSLSGDSLFRMTQVEIGERFPVGRALRKARHVGNRR